MIIKGGDQRWTLGARGGGADPAAPPAARAGEKEWGERGAARQCGRSSQPAPTSPVPPLPSPPGQTTALQQSMRARTHRPGPRPVGAFLSARRVRPHALLVARVKSNPRMRSTHAHGHTLTRAGALAAQRCRRPGKGPPNGARHAEQAGAARPPACDARGEMVGGVLRRCGLPPRHPCLHAADEAGCGGTGRSGRSFSLFEEFPHPRPDHRTQRRALGSAVVHMRGAGAAHGAHAQTHPSQAPKRLERNPPPLPLGGCF